MTYHCTTSDAPILVYYGAYHCMTSAALRALFVSLDPFQFPADLHAVAASIPAR